MSSISVQTRSTKPPQGTGISTRGTDSSTSSCRLSKDQNTTGSLRESISSFPSERSSNAANQATNSTRSTSQDNVPHSSITPVSRSSASRFASQTTASKTTSSISGFFLGQHTKPVSEKSNLWCQVSASEPANQSNFVDQRKLRVSNVPLTASSSDSVEICPTRYRANKDGSRSPSEVLTCDRPQTVSHSGESNNTDTDNGKARRVNKSLEVIVSLSEKGASCSTGETVDSNDLSSAVKGSSSCSPHLVAIPLGSLPIDIVVGCGSNRKSGLLHRTASAASHRSDILANSSIVDESINCSPSSTDPSISKSRSSTPSTREGPSREGICLATETYGLNEKTRTAKAPISFSNISSSAQQSLKNIHPENVPENDLLLLAPTSECSIDTDDFINSSSISDIHRSVSQTAANRRKPLLHMTISSNSDVEFLFDRTQSDASTRTELSFVVVKTPRSGPQIEAPVHVVSDNGSSLEQFRAAVDKICPAVSTGASGGGSGSTGFSSIDTQLSSGQPDRPSLDVSDDDESGVHRYKLRCQDKLVPSDSDPGKQKMAFMCKIENGSGSTTSSPINTQHSIGHPDIHSLDVSGDVVGSGVQQYRLRCQDRLVPSDSDPAKQKMAFVCKIENSSDSAALSPIDTQLSFGRPDIHSLDVSGDVSGVQQYRLRCQDKLVPSGSDPATQKMAFVCKIEKCQATGAKEDITCLTESESQFPETSQNELKLLAALREGHSCSDRITGSYSASVSHASSVSEDDDLHLKFVGASQNPETLTDNHNCRSESELILPKNSTNSLKKARDYFKELCSRYGNCSIADATISDAQQPSESPRPQEKSDHLSKSDHPSKSDHLSKSAAKYDASPKSKICLQSSRYVNKCSSKPTEVSTGFSKIRNDGRKSNEVSCCKPSAENDLEESLHRLEEEDDGSIIEVSNKSAQNMNSGESVCGKSDSDSSDGAVRLIDATDAKPRTRALMLRLSLSVSASSLGSDTDGSIENNAEDTETQTIFINLLTEQTQSAALDETGEPQTDTTLLTTPVDVNNSDILPTPDTPENSVETDTKDDSSVHPLPNPDLLMELTQPLPSQPVSSEEPMSEENALTHFPTQSVSISPNKLLENSDQLPAGAAKESYTTDREQYDIISSVTQRKETHSERGHRQESSDFDSDFHDEKQNETRDYAVGYSQDEHQTFTNNDRGFRNSQLHNQRCRAGRFNDSLLTAETPTGMTSKDSVTDFNGGMESTQRSIRKSTSTRTHPKRKALRQSLHSHKDLLHIDYQSDNFDSSSEERVATYDDYSSDGRGPSTTLPFRRDECGNRVLQTQTTDRAVRDNCGCKTKPKRSRYKTFRSDRKDMPAQARVSRVEHGSMDEHKESDRNVASDLNRKRKHGTDKNILVVTDDCVNSVSERKRSEKRKKQAITADRVFLQNLRRQIEDECGCLNVITESDDKGGFQRREIGEPKDNTKDHDSWRKDNFRSSDTLRVQPGKEEQYILSNNIHTATEFEQNNNTSTVLECIDCSCSDKAVEFVGFGRESKYEANDSCPETESVVTSNVTDKKSNNGGKRGHVKKKRHYRKQSDRITKAKPGKDDYDRSDNIASSTYPNATVEHELMGFQSSNNDVDSNLRYNRFLTTDSKGKNRIELCSDFETEMRQKSVVHSNELQLNASPLEDRVSNSDETESDSELKDSLYFDRLHKEFELVSAHQRKLDEFSQLGPECSAILREHEAQELRKKGSGTKVSPPAAYTRHQFKFHNQDSFTTLEEKTDPDLYQMKLSGRIYEMEDGKGRPSDATDNGKNCFPFEGTYKDLTLKAGKLERKGRGAKKRNPIIANRPDYDFANEHPKLANKTDYSCADLENDYFLLPCDKDVSLQKLPDCSDWTDGREAVSSEGVESSSYLESWIERNFEPMDNAECVNIKDTSSNECSIIPTCGSHICSTTESEADAEEENKCSYLLSAIVNPEIPMNEYVRKDPRSKGKQKTDSQLRSQDGKPYGEHGKSCDDRRNYRSTEKQKVDSHVQYDFGKPCDHLAYRMIGAADDTCSTTENKNRTTQGDEHKSDQLKKKQKKTKSKRKASKEVYFQPDENIPELLETNAKGEVIETPRISNKTENADRHSRHKTSSEFVDDSELKGDQEMTDSKPAQPEEMPQKLNDNEDGTKSKKNDEDEDENRGKENKLYLATDDYYTPDKNDASLSAAATQIRNSLTHDYLPAQIPAESEQLHQTDETNEANHKSGEQMKQEDSARSENVDDEPFESEKHIEKNNRKQDETKAGVLKDNSLGNTENDVPFTETEMPISRSVAEDHPSKTTDENQFHSAVDLENHSPGEEVIQVRNSLTYDRLPVQERVDVSGGMALSYLHTDVDEENSRTVEREADNLNSTGTHSENHSSGRETGIELPKRKETVSSVNETSRNDSMPSRALGVGVNQVDRNKLIMESGQKDKTSSRNSLEISSVQPTGTDKRKSIDASAKVTRQSVEVQTDDSRLKGTVGEDKNAGNNDVVSKELDRNNEGKTSQLEDVPSKSLKRNAGETLDTVTTQPTTAKKFVLPAAQDSSRELEKKSKGPLSPIESFHKMFRNGGNSKNKNMDLVFKKRNSYTDEDLVGQSRRHSSGLMTLFGTSTSNVVNHEEPSGTDLNSTENETSGNSIEQLLRVTNYSKRDSNVDVPLEEPTPDKLDRLWIAETSSDGLDRAQDSATKTLKRRTDKEGNGSNQKVLEVSKERSRQKNMEAEAHATDEGHVTGFEPSTPEYATLRELDWVSRQLLRCHKDSKKLMKDKTLIQSKLLRLKEPQTPTGDATNDAEEGEEEEEEEDEDAQQSGFCALQKNDATLPKFPLDQLRELRQRLERCQKEKESALQQKQAAQMELDKKLQTISDKKQPSPESTQRTVQLGLKDSKHDPKVNDQSSAKVKPVVANRPFYYTVMRVTEADTCSRQFNSQVRSLLTKLREERGDCCSGDDDFKDKMLWILWHQRQEAFRELVEWETHLRRMNIPDGTVRESLTQLQRQMDDRTGEIKDYKSEISQLRMQKMKMEQSMSEHIRQLVEDRWKHSVLVKTLRQRNEFLTAEVQSRKTADESSETSSQMRDREEIQALRAEIHRLVARLKVTDDCFAQGYPANALPSSRGLSDDMERIPEDDGSHLQMDNSSKRVEERTDAALRRYGTKEDAGKRKREEDLNEERTKWLREKAELEKKLKFRDKVIDGLTANTKDPRGWPSFELADSTRSKEQRNATKKPRENSDRKDHVSQFKSSPFSGRFNSEAQIEQCERKKRENPSMRNGGWSSPLLISHLSPLDKRNYRQKQLRVMQPVNCGILTQRHLVTDCTKASSRLNGSSKDPSLVDLDQDVDSEYEAILGQRHRTDVAVSDSNTGQLSDIARRMEKLEALVRGQHLLLTVTRARMTSLDDDNEFLRQQLAALRRRTCCELETDREPNWSVLLEELARARNDSNAKDFSHGATSDG